MPGVSLWKMEEYTYSPTTFVGSYRTSSQRCIVAILVEDATTIVYNGASSVIAQRTVRAIRRLAEKARNA